MRKIIATTWVTLDGYMAGSKGEMDWVTSIFDDAMGKYEDEVVSNADTLLLGRVTYQSFAGSWPKMAENQSVPEEVREYGRKLNAIRKVVFSKTLDKVEWNNSTLAREVVPEAIERMKQEPGKDMLIYGSASIVQALTNLRMIDEYQLLFHPFFLAGGKPLFEGLNEKTKLKLSRSKTHPSGVVLLCYEPVR
ncbi:MAG: dihydrofolate reductase family protein [Thaumarchaeota archaeon]|nr:dihydrofolate reductase family protein [Nitrososphaerota archaeon]